MTIADPNLKYFEDKEAMRELDRQIQQEMTRNSAEEKGAMISVVTLLMLERQWERAKSVADKLMDEQQTNSTVEGGEGKEERNKLRKRREGKGRDEGGEG